MCAERAELTPRGELVNGCTEALARTLAELPHTITRVDLDMGDVHFMDTAGLQFLDVLTDFGRQRSLTITTTNWNGQPLRILELAGLDTSDPLRSATHQGAPALGSSVVSLERAERLHVLQEEVEQLRQAIASRPVIDQARGILMAIHGCTSDEAWHILRETSQLSNTKLRDVAAAVTASAETNGPPPPPELRTALQRAIARRQG
ncbi:hypothetical protein GCM10010384_18960 [Streptomyces djakartensis]|uniref:ANTAR domain-containing protein n=1 Tax=Streptomyces djakartensis TaxID=68193 RepID=A0ABQ2ZFI0_9ACTN|nr:hypothetical protein GCM10010384_18960 [Streptomyces djakartensis]